jgi:hypothetical protein
MKNIFHIVLIVAASVLLNSCDKENMGDCFKTSGNVVTETRTVAGFKNIRTEDKLEVYVTQGANFEVKVEAPKDLKSNIKTEVTDSTLYLRNINKCNFVRDQNLTIKIHVTIPKLRLIRNGGVGTIYFQNQFVQDTMEVRIGNSGDVHIDVNVKYLSTSTHGNGDLYAKGYVDLSSHYTNGTNYLRLKDLIIKDKIILNTYTIGDCYVNAPENGVMELEIWESGNIYYSGNPASVSAKVNGKGKVIKE